MVLPSESGKMADREGDRNPDDEHVDSELTEEKTWEKFTFRRARQGDDDERHEKMNQGAVEDSAKDRLRDEKREAAARSVVNCRCREGDYEMEQQAKRRRLLSGSETRFAQCAAGYELKQTLESAASREKKRRGANEIENSAD